MDTKHTFDGFEEFDHAQFADEARERWGETEASKESARRIEQYSKEDWARIKAEGDAVTARLAELLASGQRPDAADAVDAAEAHRRHIEHFYTCSHAMHLGLARMYTSDPRFTAYFESRQEGLAAFAAAAIEANARRAGVTDTKGEDC